MKRFLKSLLYLVIVLGILLGCVYFTDAFNIFHYRNRRFTTAEPNKNYVKTKYVTDNPEQFNAFIFGSSKAHGIPSNSLPEYMEDGTELHWYNMTYSMGCPEEHLNNLKTFLKNGVDVKCVVIGIDDESSHEQAYVHEGELLRKPYEISKNSPLGFYWSYLWDGADLHTIQTLLPQVIDNYRHPEKYEEKRACFYEYGTDSIDLSLHEHEDKSRYEETMGWYYTNPDVIDQIREIKELCDENEIKLVFFTSPLYQTVYRDAVENGNYLDFLRDVSEVTPFYNFSGLNNFTMNDLYYGDINHYYQYLGDILMKVIWDIDREAIIAEASEGLAYNTQFGTYVDQNNIDQVLQDLEQQVRINIKN